VKKGAMELAHPVHSAGYWRITYGI